MYSHQYSSHDWSPDRTQIMVSLSWDIPFNTKVISLKGTWQKPNHSIRDSLLESPRVKILSKTAWDITKSQYTLISTKSLFQCLYI